MSDEAFQWEVFTGCHGAQVFDYFKDTDGALDFCGRILYGNSLFDLLLLRVRRVGGKRTGEDDEFCARVAEATTWVMRIFEEDGGFRDRQLATKHELFAMLIAELRLGASLIEVRHRSRVRAAE